jgi:hypothetical protein
MIYTTAADAYATTALTPFARTLLDDATAGATLTTLGVTAFAQTVLDDTDAATARATLGANNAANLTTGTIPSARLNGAYVDLTQVAMTTDGEAVKIVGSSTGDPYVGFWKAAVRQGYIQHQDGSANTNGLKLQNDIGGCGLYIMNAAGNDSLIFNTGSAAKVVLHRGNLVAGDVSSALGYTPANSGISITAGNGLTGGGTLATTRTLTLGTPSDITNSTANSVSGATHTHALGFVAAEVYTGTSSTTTSFPIGTVLTMAQNGSNPARQASVIPCLYSTNAYVQSGYSGAGPALSGTWRVRGIVATSDWLLIQRTA